MLDGLCGGNDGDALVLTAQAMQMFVAGDDQIDPSGQGARENVVVVGIVLDHARHFLGRGHVGQASQLHDDALRRQAGLRQTRCELLARKYIEQFGQQRCAAAQLEDVRS